jgi:preprotein translocase SecE subunit
LHQVISEMRKVAWPTQDELAHNAVLLLGVLLVVIGSIAMVDIAFANLIRVVTAGG